MVTLCWAPQHSGIEGNEKVDVVANQAVSSKLVGVQSYCGIPRSTD